MLFGHRLVLNAGPGHQPCAMRGVERVAARQQEEHGPQRTLRRLAPVVECFHGRHKLLVGGGRRVERRASAGSTFLNTSKAAGILGVALGAFALIEHLQVRCQHDHLSVWLSPRAPARAASSCPQTAASKALNTRP